MEAQENKQFSWLSQKYFLTSDREREIIRLRFLFWLVGLTGIGGIVCSCYIVRIAATGYFFEFIFLQEFFYFLIGFLISHFKTPLRIC